MFKNILDSGLGLVNNIATEISTAFTGTDTGKGVVMIIFYLVVAIGILLLLRLFVWGLKSLFREIFPKKTPKPKVFEPVSKPVSKQEEVSSFTPPVSQEEKTLLFVKSFDCSSYLNKLSEAFASHRDFAASLKTPEAICTEAPQDINAENPGTINVTDAQKESLSGKVQNKTLDELTIFLASKSKEKKELDQATALLNNNISELRNNRAAAVKKELDAQEKYNTLAAELAVLVQQFKKQQEELSKQFKEDSESITNTSKKVAILLDSLKGIEAEVLSVPGTVDAFSISAAEITKAFSAEYQSKRNALDAAKKDYDTSRERREKADSEIIASQKKLAEKATEIVLQDALISIAKEKKAELLQLEAERKAKEAEERRAREEAARLAKEEAERKAKEERERRAKEEAERKEREEAERKAKEEAKRQAAAAAAVTESHSDTVAEMKAQLQQHSASSYAINFDNISPEMLEKLARQKQKAPKPTENAESAGEDGEDSSNDNNASVSGNPTEGTEKPDYISELKQQWAEERAHKEEWEAELARKKEEELRRKEELAKKYSNNN